MKKKSSVHFPCRWCGGVPLTLTFAVECSGVILGLNAFFHVWDLSSGLCVIDCFEGYRCFIRCKDFGIFVCWVCVLDLGILVPEVDSWCFGLLTLDFKNSY